MSRACKSMFNSMINLQDDDFYLVLPSHARSEGVYDNRPHHFKVDLPKELFLEGAWEVGVTKLLCTHTFYEPATFALTSENARVLMAVLILSRSPKNDILATTMCFKKSVFEAMAVDLNSLHGCCNPRPECSSRYPRP